MESIFTGVSIAFQTIIPSIALEQISNDPYYHFYTKSQKDSFSLIVMVCFGFGEIIGGFFTGYILKKFGHKKTTLVQAVIVFITFLLVVLSVATSKVGYLIFMMSILFGAMDAGINIHLFNILGFEFESKVLPFAVYNLT